MAFNFSRISAVQENALVDKRINRKLRGSPAAGQPKVPAHCFNCYTQLYVLHTEAIGRMFYKRLLHIMILRWSSKI
ncbi:hypothetical protein KPH14_011658 [Odynerus spinipes]|uniref:Uncharacterized protein n=1 Tax=Odynerus spinipes TaxID=1348599 RepID=A0AAD9VLZ7_9HYME|nr:hypothetical protein KPH14_011658 [Odynerus spinipes]